MKANKITVTLPLTAEWESEVLTPDALEFLYELHQRFNPTRKSLLKAREIRQRDFDRGNLPQFLAHTEDVRASDWTVNPVKADLMNRRVEITGPAEAKMMINALNSSVDSFMVDLEDSLSPTFENILQGQVNIKKAVRKTLSYFDEIKKKNYELNAKTATLIVRPRGWHLPEKHLKINDEFMSASLVDFGLYLFHNGSLRLESGSGPYLYLPKLESHLEARLWNDVFDFTEEYLNLERGGIKATVLIETILAAFEMDEILYELRTHSSGLNAGRWDYIFSIIKKFRNHPDRIFPDRAQVTMATPFMRSYAELLVKTCHKRGTHAMGGMAAFIPSRKDEEINKNAMAKVAEDKAREANAGFDGTWIAHPDLADVARAEFVKVMGTQPNQKDQKRDDVHVTAADLLNFKIEGGVVSHEGVATNIRVAIQYIDHWLKGLGAVALYHLMEDAATAEISRAQLWQWLHNHTWVSGGVAVTKEYYQEVKNKELEKLGDATGTKFQHAVALLDDLVLSKEFKEFLTLPAYDALN